MKPHGLRGEVVVAPVSDVAQRFVAGSVLELEDRDVKVLGGRRHSNRWIVKFEGIDDRDAAERLRGAVLWGAPLGDAPDGAFWVHELVGSRVVDRAGIEHGRVVAVQENPAHELLVLEGGELVPLVFVIEADGDKLVVDVPEGLFDV